MAPRATTTYPRRSRGLVLLLVLLTAGTAVLLGAGSWSAIAGVDDDGVFAAVLVQLVAGVMALSLALSLGQLEAHRAVGPPEEAQRPPVALIVWGGITALLAVASAVAAVIAGIPAVLTVGVLLGLVGMAACSWLLGQRARLGSQAREQEARASGAGPAPDLDWTPAVLRRKVRTIVLVGLVGAAAGLVAVLLLGDAFDDGVGIAAALAVVLQLAFLAAAITSAVVSRPALTAMAPITRDLSAAERKAVGRRTKGTGEPLAPRLERRAARLAAVSLVVQGFQLATASLIMVSSAMTFVRLGLDGPLLVVVIVVAVAFVAFLPYVVIDARRRRRYVASTRELARSTPDAVEA
ncbi:hypothetical protein C5B94_05205 [Clavibacter michiganensis]|nr:hypothetical protein C5B94_05205 [Clavibacter michiganensis]